MGLSRKVTSNKVKGLLYSLMPIVYPLQTQGHLMRILSSLISQRMLTIFPVGKDIEI